ncbi:DUF4097 family beta strand repeat-containing protein [Leucobacter ruminantium]|uniref:DUF4097 family beta strand repeat protein n=1 Tax=Leucobacter ruminantium TaxID=1289170 RepID=A0A939M0R4_9MICO|nr:DUF4097 family beta strand repeat-containing protein [Leucobacter ruminantium]MBO1806458.1 DUF4097 family beta strand repeat protein [Leucobacter ruminantium]
MSTQTNTPGTPSGSGDRDPRRSAAARPIMIATAAVGGLVLLTAGASAAFAAVSDARAASPVAAQQGVTDLTGITGVDLDIGGADVTLVFGDVEEASIAAAGRDSDRWRMVRSGSELVVESPSRFFDLCLGWCDERRAATITLPNELEGVDLDISLGSGQVHADGTFRDLGIDVGAGKAIVTGSARSVDAELSAGALDAELADVRSAAFEVSAGGGDVRLTGRAPDEVEAEVSAGSLKLQLPDEMYRVDTDVSAGDITNELRVDSASEHRVTASVSAGDLVLLPGEKPAR